MGLYAVDDGARVESRTSFSLLVVWSVFEDDTSSGCSSPEEPWEPRLRRLRHKHAASNSPMITARLTLTPIPAFAPTPSVDLSSLFVEEEVVGLPLARMVVVVECTVVVV
jgi:hypothetical protein